MDDDISAAADPETLDQANDASKDIVELSNETRINQEDSFDLAEKRMPTFTLSEDLDLDFIDGCHLRLAAARSMISSTPSS